MSKSLHTAAEIAAMKLGGLPASRENVQRRAEREGWYSEERTGRGGVHKVYEIPAHYLDGSKPDAKAKAANVAQLASNEDLLQVVIKAVETWQESRGKTIPTDRKAALIALIYRYFQAQQGRVDKDEIDAMINRVA